MHHRALKTLAAVAVATLTVLTTPDPAFADDVRDDQWYLDALGIEKAHKLSQGEGVTIGVIDGGIDAAHPDLKGNIKAGKDFGDSKGKGLRDVDGHGTSVSSLIVGHGHGAGNAKGVMGIAPKAEVVSAGFDCTDQCDGGQLITDAIIWLIDQDVDVISISMSSAADNNEALNYATEKGVPVVAATGNLERTELEKKAGAEPSTMTSWPAAAPGAIPVSGTTEAETFWQHSITLKDAADQPQLGISAPAENLVTAKKGGGYATNSGTSGSTPIVAGTLALIKSAYPELTYNQWVDRLLDSADDKGPKGFDDKFGAGIVNPYRALTEETTFESLDGDQVSSPEDRLPLDEQGKDSASGSKGKDGSSTDGGQALSGSSSSIWLIAVGIILAVVVTTVAIFVLLIAKRRTSTNNTSASGSG